MDKKTKKRAFEHSFTGNKVRKCTGAGITSSYGTVKHYGATINDYSVKGHKTTSSICQPPSKKENLLKGSVKREMIGGEETILLVDDDNMVADVIEQTLTFLGYKVLIARSGHEALAIYEKNVQEVDLIILNMVMPGMGGGEVFHRLQEISPSVKVLLSSGSYNGCRVAEILNCGCKGLIQKPFTIEELSLRVREVLDKD